MFNNNRGLEQESKWSDGELVVHAFNVVKEGCNECLNCPEFGGGSAAWNHAA
jgi:hypothetical protein